MTTLYSLALDGIEIEQLLFDSVGEITPEIQVKLDAVLESGPPMMEAAAAVVRQLQFSAQVAEEESKRLHARAKEFDAQADKLKERMTFALDKSFGGKIKTAKWSMWTQKSADRVLADLVPGTTAEMVHEDYPELVRVKMELDRVECVNRYKPIRNIQNRMHALQVVIDDAKRALNKNPEDEASAGALDAALKAIPDLVSELEKLPGLPELILFEEKEGERAIRIK